MPTETHAAHRPYVHADWPTCGTEVPMKCHQHTMHLLCKRLWDVSWKGIWWPPILAAALLALHTQEIWVVVTPVQWSRHRNHHRHAPAIGHASTALPHLAFDVQLYQWGRQEWEDIGMPQTHKNQLHVRIFPTDHAYIREASVLALTCEAYASLNSNLEPAHAWAMDDPISCSQELNDVVGCVQ